MSRGFRRAAHHVVMIIEYVEPRCEGGDCATGFQVIKRCRQG